MNYFIDFEANSPSGEIISIGCVSENGEEFYSLVNCSTPLDNYVKKITHLRQEQIDKAKLIDTVLVSFFSWLMATNKKDYFNWNDTKFYHYGSEDTKFIKATLKNIQNSVNYEQFSAVMTRCANYDKEVQKFFSINQPISLIAAANYFKTEPEEQTHNALDDAKLLKSIFENIDGKESIGPVDFTFDHKIIVRKHKKKKEIVKYKTVDEVLTFCMANIPEEYRHDDKIKNRMRNRLKKAIIQKTKYCGFNWSVE